MIKLNKKKGNCINKKTYLVIPSVNAIFREELSDCLKQINLIVQENAPNFKILKMNVFIDVLNISEFINIKNESLEFISNFSKNNLDIYNIPILFIAQPPANHKKVIIEISAILASASEYIYEFYNRGEGSNYKLITGENIEIYGSINDVSLNKTNIYLQSSNCFEFMKDVLEANNLNFHNVVRQWAYIGNMNSYNLYEGSEIENYQMFNLSRVKYYKNSDWKYGYPSATGIGSNVDGFSLEFSAINEIETNKIIPLHNPRQLDAHRYSEKFQVVSSSIKENIHAVKIENTPKFERGKVVITDNTIDIYISGTAAIIGEDSINGDITEQTKITLENISGLASKDNLIEHGIEIINDIPKISYARAYIKHAKDLLIVEELCMKFFGEIPVLYVIADVCRKELLIEIEALLSL